jgi:hypothetical protein
MIIKGSRAWSSRFGHHKCNGWVQLCMLRALLQYAALLTPLSASLSNQQSTCADLMLPARCRPVLMSLE